MADPFAGLAGQAAKVITAAGVKPWYQQPLSWGGVTPWLKPLLSNPYTAAVAGGIGLGNIPAVKQPMQRMWGISDFETAYKDYQAGGGALSYNKWAAAGKPKSAQPLMSKEQAEARFALAQVGKKPPEEDTGVGMPVRYETITENGWQYSIGYNAKGEITERVPLGRVETPPSTAITPFQQAQLDYQQQQDAQAQANWQAQQAWQQQEAAQQQGWQQQQLEQERQQQQEQMGWYRQQAQMQQAEQERQYRSQLAASPMSWLQYSSYTGEQPVIQPWMLPLMPQQYAGTTAGEKLPGWQAGGSMTALPGLTTPSAQYWGRMGPTAQQQYMGYQQGQGGINPMETQFRLQAQAPPGGRNYGLTWGR